MSTFALLNNVDHKDTRVITERSARYGDAVMFAMVFPFEFRSVQAFYPILFHRDQRGEMYPVALFGFEAGENLFLDDSGWHARYVPAMIRRQPFLIGFEAATKQGEGEQRRMLSLDMAHPRVSKERGEPLFQPLGGRTPFLEEMAALLETIYQGAELNKKFVQALQELGLIEYVTFDIALADGSRNQLLGFFAIDEEKVRGLSGEVLGQLSSSGFLMPLFMMLASTANVRTLVEMKNSRLKG
ncbi:MAG: SapC family protein [Gammaproteobacteria bacterium]|nr:SapC family protein [Gammaproteobacteria bacterium]MDH4255777.1 SapC family protein [Gammaproteobacteria bacterium]MDH5272680.1 SapC family protein [Gammaproteobacteria bacterium]